jgi:Spy/CpxP family protein refolding chaperone
LKNIQHLIFILLIPIIVMSVPASSEVQRIEPQIQRSDEIQPPVIDTEAVIAQESDALKDALAVPSAVPRGPQDVLRDYEAGMSSLSQQFSAKLGVLVQAVEKGELSRDQGENISAEQYQASRMQFELLSALHAMLQADVAHAAVAQPQPAAAKQSEIVMVALPFSSLELSPALSQYLDLSPQQVTAIEQLMSQERRELKPLVDEMQATRTKLLAASGHPQANKKEVKTLAAAQAGMLTKLIVANSRMQARLYKLLTVEQRKKLEAFKQSNSSELALQAGQ